MILTTGYGKPQPARKIPHPPRLRRAGSGRRQPGSSPARPAAEREGQGMVLLLCPGLEHSEGWKMARADIRDPKNGTAEDQKNAAAILITLLSACFRVKRRCWEASQKPQLFSCKATSVILHSCMTPRHSFSSKSLKKRLLQIRPSAAQQHSHPQESSCCHSERMEGMSIDLQTA